MIGLVLALGVVAVVVSLFGGWPYGIAIAAVAIIVLVLSRIGLGRRSAESRHP